MLPAVLAAQSIKPALEHVRWEAGIEVDDGNARVVLHAEIADGWKLYALDTPPPSPALRLSAAGPGGVAVGAFSQSEPAVEDDPSLGVQVRLFRDKATFTAPVGIEAGAAPSGVVEVSILFTICDKRICLPPTPHTITAALPADLPVLRIAETPLSPVPGQVVAPPDFTTDAPAASMDVPSDPADLSATDAAAAPPSGGSIPVVESGDRAGLGGFLLLAIAAGLAALLMPCVFPMIPLTVSYFTRHSHSRGEAVRMAALYGFSIVATFTGLGLLMALLVGASGAQRIAADPFVNLFIGIVFVLFGLSLLGLFELRLPSGLVNSVGRHEQRGGLVGVLFMGLTLTLVSFSCTVPFVGGLLAATMDGAWFDPVVGMLAFSITFALPFVLFALFPRALQALPQSGAWMERLKVTLGFVELVAALKFLSQADLLWGWEVFTRPLTISLSVVLFALCGLYLLGKLPLSEAGRTERLGVGRLMAAVGFFGLALYLLPGMLGASLGTFDAYLPPRRATDFTLNTAAAPAAAEAWHEGIAGIETARAEARLTGKPIFVDFTGYTCTNCRFMEANVFTDARVQAHFARDVVLLRLYTDDIDEGARLSRYQLEQTGTVALPTYALLDLAGDRVLAQHSGVASVEEFLAFLGKARPDDSARVVVHHREKQDGTRAFFENG